MLRPYWRTRRRFARRPAGCCASDSAWGTFACRDRRPAASASTPITSAPVAAGSGRCSSTNTRPVACSATAAVSVDHPLSAGCGRWATTSWAGGRIESAARNERGSQRVRHGAPHPQGGPERDDLAEPPSGIPRQIDERGDETRIVGGGRGVVGGEHHGAGLGEPALGGGQSVRPPRGVESVAPGGGNLSLRRGALLRLLGRLGGPLVRHFGGLVASGVSENPPAQAQRLGVGLQGERPVEREIGRASCRERVGG